MNDTRCRATYNTARCSHQRHHPGAHYSRLNNYSWTAPGEYHITTTRPAA